MTITTDAQDREMQQRMNYLIYIKVCAKETFSHENETELKETSNALKLFYGYKMDKRETTGSRRTGR
jgi:hypothetical protein